MSSASARRLVFAWAGLLAPTVLYAQELGWEVGGAVGYSFYRNATLSTTTSEGSAGFRHGFAFSVVGGHNMYRYIGGEFRYARIANELKLSLGGQEARFGGESHAFHYDFLFHAAPTGARVRPFAAVGGGAKLYRGTGRETATQPLIRFAALSRVSEVQALVSFGVGVKMRISRNALLRFEMRDYATPFPDEVIAPLRGTRISGWLHDFVPLAGISLVF